MISQDLKMKINQIKDLDKRRGRPGISEEAYAEISITLADKAVGVIESLFDMINKRGA